MQEWVLAQHGIWAYAGIFFLLLSGAIGLPIPEDLPLIFSGILIHEGTVRPSLIFIVCYSGILVGDLLIFGLGRHFGKALYKKEWFRSRMNAHQMLQVKHSLERRSLLMIFIARHLFYLRTVTFLTCGALKMPLMRFLAADAVAALISAPLMISLGYFGAEHYDAVVAWMGKAKLVSAFLAVGVVVGVVVWWRRHKQRLAADAAAAAVDEMALERELAQEPADRPLS